MKILYTKRDRKKIIDILRKRKIDVNSVQDTVIKIINNIRKKGDEALLKYTRRYDRAGKNYKLKCVPKSVCKKYAKSRAVDSGGSKKQSGSTFPLLSASFLAPAGNIAIYLSKSNTARLRIS